MIMREKEETVELLKMKKRITDLEAEVKNQREALYMHLEQDEQGIEELKKIIESFKEVMQCMLGKEFQILGEKLNKTEG